MSTLGTVLSAHGLSAYVDSFVEVGITAAGDLQHLGLDDFHTLGVDDVKDRKKLFNLIAKVKAGESLEVRPSAASRSAKPSPKGGSSGLPGPRGSASHKPKPGGSTGGSKGNSGLPKPSGLPRSSGLPKPSGLPTRSGLPKPSGLPTANTGLPKPTRVGSTPSSKAASAPSPAASRPPASGTPSDDFLRLHENLMKIRVAVRTRPLSNKEKKKKETNEMVMPDSQSLVVTEHKVKVDLTKYTETHNFEFDECIGPDAVEDEVYRRIVQPLISAVFNKAKTTCFAYGQTGSGKTFTMGPMPIMAADDILRCLEYEQFSHLRVSVSIFEIYLSSVFDLLNNRKRLVIREDSNKVVHVVGLEEVPLDGNSTHEVLNELLQVAEKHRSTAPTHANAKSSRSHQIIQIALRDDNGDLWGKCAFVDLAGAEWGADIKDTNRQTRMEGAEINKSLLALKECIRALDRDSGHVPFRGSKLTEVLKDSFVGNSYTIMLACVSPASGSVEHSLNTLRYADRVRELQNDKDKSKPYVDKLTPGGLPGQRQSGNRAKTGESQMMPPSKPAQPGGQPVFNRTKSGSFVVRDENERDLVAETAQDEVQRRHDELINTILEEEEQLLTDHRTEIEETMHLVKEEMALLDMMDNPGTQVDEYAMQLDKVLANKVAVITGLRDKLKIFQEHLKEEDQMSKAFDKTATYSRLY